MSLLQLLLTAQFDPHAIRGYDVFAGGFRWSDEFPAAFIDEAMRQTNWDHRSLIAHRSSIILGNSDDKYKRAWEHLWAIHPNWPGFRSERCTLALAAELEGEKQRVLREFDSLLDDA